MLYKGHVSTIYSQASCINEATKRAPSIMPIGLQLFSGSYSASNERLVGRMLRTSARCVNIAMRYGNEVCVLTLLEAGVRFMTADKTMHLYTQKKPGRDAELPPPDEIYFISDGDEVFVKRERW